LLGELFPFGCCVVETSGKSSGAQDCKTLKLADKTRYKKQGQHYTYKAAIRYWPKPPTNQQTTQQGK